MINLVVSIPSVPGMWRSIRVTSGRSARYASRASRLLPASPASRISAWFSRIDAIPFRTRGWSSTHNTRITDSSRLMKCLQPARRQFGEGSLAGENLHANGSAKPPGTNQIEFRPDVLRALFHTDDAVMVRLAVTWRRIYHAAAVIRDGES